MRSVILTLILSWLLLLTPTILAQEIEIETMKQLEAYEITQTMLDDWNIYNPFNELTPTQAEKPKYKKAVYLWYFNVRLPQLMKANNIQDSLFARIILYHAGLECFTEGKPIPDDTNELLKRYKIYMRR